jgi:hypothetical protein
MTWESFNSSVQVKNQTKMVLILEEPQLNTNFIIGIQGIGNPNKA